MRDMQINAAELWTRWPTVREVGGRLEPNTPVEWWSPWATFLATQQRARSTDRPYLELTALGAALSDHRQQAVWRDLSTAWLQVRAAGGHHRFRGCRHGVAAIRHYPAN